MPLLSLLGRSTDHTYREWSSIRLSTYIPLPPIVATRAGPHMSMWTSSSASSARFEGFSWNGTCFIFAIMET